jgi:hypothetical protein
MMFLKKVKGVHRSFPLPTSSNILSRKLDYEYKKWKIDPEII